MGLFDFLKKKKEPKEPVSMEEHITERKEGGETTGSLDKIIQDEKIKDKVKQTINYYYDEHDSVVSKRISNIRKYDSLGNKVVDIDISNNYHPIIKFERQFHLRKFDKNNNPINHIVFRDEVSDLGQVIEKIKDRIWRNFYNNKYNENGQLIQVEEHWGKHKREQYRETIIKKYVYKNHNLEKILTETFSFDDKKILSQINEFKYDTNGKMIEERSTQKDHLNSLSSLNHNYNIKNSFYFDDENNEVKETLTSLNGESQTKIINHFEYENGLKKYEIDKSSGTTDYGIDVTNGIKYKYKKKEFMYEESEFFNDPLLIFNLNEIIEIMGQKWDINYLSTQP